MPRAEDVNVYLPEWRQVLDVHECWLGWVAMFHVKHCLS
jgi:hypothetical protein